MNILMVTHYFDSHGGGIELVAKRMCRGLAKAGCRVLWAAAGASASPDEVANSSSLQLKTWNRVEELTGVPFPVPTLGALRRLRSAVRGADVVVLHDCLYLSNIAAYLFAWMRGTPVVVIQHIGIVPYSSRILRGVMALANAVVARPMLAAAHQVVFISENTKRYFRSVRFSRPPIIIFNGVDCEAFHPLGTTESRAEIRGRLGLPQNQPLALFVGRFVPKKGLGVLREMAAREPRITWAFAGTGALDPAAWGLDNVRVFSVLREHSLAELYRASDVFVLPSTGEGFPLVLQEALASGIPVVCGAESAGADPAVRAFFRGIELAPGNDQLSAERFLAAINQVLRAATHSGLAQQQHEFARSRYSWQLALRRYSELFTALAHTPAIASTGAAAKVRSAFAGANGTPQGGV